MEAGMEPGDVILTFDGTEVMRHARMGPHRSTPKWAKPSRVVCPRSSDRDHCASRLRALKTRKRGCARLCTCPMFEAPDLDRR